MGILSHGSSGRTPAHIQVEDVRARPTLACTFGSLPSLWEGAEHSACIYPRTRTPLIFPQGKKRPGGILTLPTTQSFASRSKGRCRSPCETHPLRLPGDSPVPADPQQLARTHLEPSRSGRSTAYTTQPQHGPAAPKIPPSPSPQNDSVSPQSAALPGILRGMAKRGSRGSLASLPKHGGNKNNITKWDEGGEG